LAVMPSLSSWVRYWWRFRARMMPIRAVPDGISAGDDPVLLDSA
jgi:hypothetical protein